MMLLLPVLLALGLGLGAASGFLQRRFQLRPSWVLLLLLMAGAFCLPASLLISRVREVLGNVADAPEPVNALAVRFAVLSGSLLGGALILTFVGLFWRPFLAPLVPPALFATFYEAALPLAYRVRAQQEALVLDNTPTIWLFVFCGVASAALLGYALGQQEKGPR